MVCKHQSELPKFSSSQIQQSLDDSKKVFDATYTFWEELKDKLSGQDKTFFKEGIFWYFEPFAWVTQMKNVLIPDIDLSEIVTFFGYRKSDPVGCFRRCKDMLNFVGYEPVDKTSKEVVQMTKYKSETQQVLEIQPNIQKGIEIIDKHLERGVPITVGVDHSLDHTGNYDKTTDHWILIVGRKADEKGIYYRYFDPQTEFEKIGTNLDNKLYLQEDSTLKGTYRKGSKYEKKYTVTVVRPNIEK
jgi:hypothetical protein